MSETEIFLVSKNSCEFMGETKNSFRSAMYVWNYIAKKYFHLPSFPIFDLEVQSKVWNAQNHHKIPDHEVIVLMSTMDKVTVKSCDLPKLINAFNDFFSDHPNSSFGEQAEIIKNISLGDGEFIAWNQTNVGEFCFSPKYNESGEISEFNDLSESWDLFQEFSMYKCGDQ